MPVHNSDIEAIFNKVADLLDIEGANQYRVRAYRNAAQTVSGFSRNFSDMVEQDEDLTRIEGIGKDLAQKIQEAVQTGTLTILQDLEKRIPTDLLQLLGIAGLGPRKVKTLYEQLGIKNMQDLKKAAENEEIRKLQGFGRKTEENILKKLQQLEQREPRRFKLSIMEEIASSLVKHLKQAAKVGNIDVAGSFRRRKETVKDLDILVTAENSQDIMQHFLDFEDVGEVLMHGETRTSVELKSGVQVDLRVVPKESYGAALHYFTGSKSHNIAVRQLAIEKDLKINEYGVFKGEKQVAGKTEPEVYSYLGLSFIEPELRENTGELEAAKKYQLPRLLTLDDIRGDLHIHSRYTDGKNSLKELAQAALDLGYEYLAITDHTQRLKVTGGLDSERLNQQMEEIDHLNEELKDIVLLKGAEVDILQDGSLDLPGSILKKLDLTVCAVHSNFNMAREKQTERILRAMDNKYFKILAHPTGRLINERDPLDLDMDKLITGTAERNCFLEINSQPDRLDLNDVYTKYAKEKGIKLAISTDSHQTSSFRLIRFGLGQARRGWLEKNDVLNAQSLKELKNLLKR